MNGKTAAEQIADWADVLRSLSANGLRYSKNVYDRANYERIQQLTLEMLALVTAHPLTELEPLRQTLFTLPGPISTVDAAIINEAGKILLIRRADNGKWAMPGGGLDVGETPAEGAVREALEETGVRAEPVLLAAVHDSRLWPGHNYVQQHNAFTFLCRPLPVLIEPASHAAETLGTAWFAEDDLPADLDPNHTQRVAYAFQTWRGETRAYFDKTHAEPSHD